MTPIFDTTRSLTNLIDVQVRTTPVNGRSLLTVQLVGERERVALPPLTWFDANRLQQFTQRLADGVVQAVDLTDAGLRLTATGLRQPEYTVRVEPLPGCQFRAFTLNGQATTLRRTAKVLYRRLWEAFCRG